MTPFLSLCLFVGIALGCLCLAKVRDWPTSQLLRKRVKPEDVQVHPETLQAITQSDFRITARPDVERRIQQHCWQKGFKGSPMRRIQ